MAVHGHRHRRRALADLQHGDFPWIALTLACSFAGYGLVRKLVGVPPVRGLGVESLYLVLPALALLLWGEFNGMGGFIAHGGIASWGWTAAALLVFGGVLTALPLIGFADAVKRIPYSMVGVLQYIAPTLPLLCGVLVLGEAFDINRAIGFGFIWIALIVYAADGLLRARVTSPGAQ